MKLSHLLEVNELNRDEYLRSNLPIDNDGLVELVKKHNLEYRTPLNEKVLEAMKKVDRKDFLVPIPITICTVDAQILQSILGELANRENNQNLRSRIMDLLNSAELFRITYQDLAYHDMVVYIGRDQNCSQPSLVGFMIDLLELNEGMKVLEVGSGCGYHAAIVSHLIGASGYLVSIERIPELCELSEQNLRAHFGEGLEKRVRLVQGDGSTGFREEAPYDRIYLTAGVKSRSFNPLILAGQLRRERGILLFPETSGAMIKQTYENRVLIEEKRYKGVRFVPLRGKNT